MRLVYAHASSEGNAGSRLEVHVTPEGNVRITCDRAGERAVSHELSRGEFGHMTESTREALAK